MNGGIPPLRDRHLAAGFIILMYLLLGALAAALIVAGFSGSDVMAGVAAVVGGASGAAFGVRRIRRAPEAPLQS
ncbi:hypothetical protein OG866_42135 [Streptomyces sp. NBC_00663]|uniref:hypothetical protein n=1 Tax=Streptomyces sp. NBC_00663 TaxID=2975801 RepID=UPI002E2FA4D5|nr:hypothetical protein [Streptomyces sp. NBC_00663]